MSAADSSISATASRDTSEQKIPNSPTTAFAALSLNNNPSTSTSPFTPAHLGEIDNSTKLVQALEKARNAPKPLIRSTGHLVSTPDAEHHLLSWKVAEFAYRKSTSIGSELPTLARGLFTERIGDSSNSACVSSCSTDASTSSTPTPVSDADQVGSKHRIVVRGYDKFFNLNEMPWTKPSTILHYTTPPYVLTFKENGCIIFISSLSPTQLVVTSKYSLGSIDGTTVTHAEKGTEWMKKHLSSVGKTEQELAQALWERNETAAFELCDDSFEEHVLAYSQARSGLHLHGLNSNSAHFRTRSMPEVDAFAKEFGFIPTRWITLSSLQEVQRVTAEIEQTGSWDGEAIEGFVIRTHMPGRERMEELKREQEGVVSPPYSPGQAWFYKVKFDEPYLMYRDWRELARKMVKEKQEWEAKVAAHFSSSNTAAAADSSSFSPVTDSTTITTTSNATPDPTTTPSAIETQQQGGVEKSKAALKRERKLLQKQSAKPAATQLATAQAAGLVAPSPPQPRSKRPETVLFIQWCYDRLYGNPSLGIKAQPGLFAGLTANKGIIAMREAFLSYLSSQQPTSSSTSGGTGTGMGEEEEEEEKREYSKTILTPIAVPGCGKTLLALALRELFSVGLVQSDDYKKKSGFLTAIEKDLRSHAAETNYVLFADKNNHLYSHRDELVDLATHLSKPSPSSPPSSGKKGKKAPPEIGRIRKIALAWDLDSLPLNTLHRICASRVEKRGDNHQTLVADTDKGSVAGLKSHEVVLWRFLEALQPFGGNQGLGEGAEGWGDGRFDHVVRLRVSDTAEENLTKVVKELSDVLGWKMPCDERGKEALDKALNWKVAKKPNTAMAREKKEKEGLKDKTTPQKEAETNNKTVGPGGARYFGLAVELDVRSLLDRVLLSHNDTNSHSMESGDISQFYRQMRQQKRLNLRPHITLVHNSNLSINSGSHSQSGSGSGSKLADEKWEFYSQLLLHRTSSSSSFRKFEEVTQLKDDESEEKEGEEEAVFTVTITKLLYEPEKLLVLPVDAITPPPHLKSKFNQLHGEDGDWTPHITIATANNEIRTYEANRVVSGWLENNKQPMEGKIAVINLAETVCFEARVFGMT